MAGTVGANTSIEEVELKGVVANEADLRRRVESLGGHLELEGRMIDLRFDAPDGSVQARRETLRLRYEADGSATLAWKGPTRQGEYKVREEIETRVADAGAARAILDRLGMRLVHRLERDIVQYTLDRTVLRFERYPQLDELLEVEGTPLDIESTLVALGLDRAAFTSEPLAAFVARFEARTGTEARLTFDEAEPDRFPRREFDRQGPRR